MVILLPDLGGHWKKTVISLISVLISQLSSKPAALHTSHHRAKEKRLRAQEGHKRSIYTALVLGPVCYTRDTKEDNNRKIEPLLRDPIRAMTTM
jgi:hypothetical protein